MKKDGIKWLRLLPLLVLAAGLVIIVKTGIRAMNAYDERHTIEHDKTDNNELLYEPVPHWRKLDLGGYTVTPEQFGVIGGEEDSFPIFAELKRQCGGTSGEEINDAMRSHYRSCWLGFWDTFTEEAQENDHTFNECHLLITCELTDSFKKCAKDNNIEIEYEVIGYNDMVFFTHRDNPVDSLSSQQIRDIYGGKITNWKDVGGNDEEIAAYQRGESYTQNAMVRYVMGGTSLMAPKESYQKFRFRAPEAPVVGEYVNGTGSIGYTFGYFFDRLYDSEDIKLLKIDGAAPDEENIRSGAYPFVIPYYAVTVNGDENDIWQVRDFLLGDGGQQVIRMSGFCPARECGE
ncbi:MAG: substrate-binding domain-containing protein [Ruminococcus sp.]|nr:substrate-binding domain-containing protein [Ruminococcus sp.]